MENRGRNINRNESERGSTSNGGDISSRSDRTNSPSEHSARRASLRLSGIDPDTWGQRSYRPQDDQQQSRHQAGVDSLPQEHQTQQNYLVLGAERLRLANETQDLPIDQQRQRHQAWVDSLPPAAQAYQNSWVLATERLRLFDQTQDLPFDQQRQRRQAWIDSLPPADQAYQNNWVLARERMRLFDQTQDLPLDQQRARHQAWVDSLPQADQAQQNQRVLDTERARLGRQTRNLPLDQQQARRQAWVDSLPQADPAQPNQILLGGVDQQIQPIPQQVLERFRQEDSNRQRHRERVEAIIQERQLDIDVPNQSTQEWSRFAIDLINEYEDQHGLGNSRLLGDILQGGTGQANSNERSSDEYRALMTWVLRKWRDHISE